MITGPFDALGRLTAEKWDSGAVTKSRSYLAGSNFSSGHSTTLTAAGTNVYTVSAMSWQGSLLAGYSVSSAWDGGGTTHAATYDADAHLQQWTATPFGASGTAQQKFGEGYTFSLENLQTVNTTNNLGFNVTATYNYGDATSAERVTSISVPNAPTMDSFVYDRRGRGLIAQHKLSATQTIAQDAYEYDSQNRLTSISHLGAKLEDLAYDGAGDLVSRTFPTGAAEIARYYVGEQLSLVNRSATTTLGYAHIQLGGTRIASFWVKSASGTNTTGVIYYHRDRRNDVVATTKNGGAMGVSYRYLPYGAIDKVVDSTGTVLTPGTESDDVVSEIGFIGGLKLSGGLIHLKARAYSPTLRRFLQPDTIDLRRYTYSNADPLNVSDPSGLTPNKDHSNDPAPTIDPNQTATDGTANKTQSQTTVTTGECGTGKCEVDTVTGTRPKKGGCDGGNCTGPAGPSVPLAPPVARPAVQRSRFPQTFERAFAYNYKTTKRVLSLPSVPLITAKTPLGMMTAGATADAFGTVTLLEGAKLIGAQIAAGDGVGELGYATLGAAGTVGSMALNTVINSAAVYTALNVGIVIGSAAGALVEAAVDATRP